MTTFALANPLTRSLANPLGQQPPPRLPRTALPPIPAAGQAQVWLDFDGTITRQDVLDKLIAEYAINDSWKLIEERWQAGLIGSYECLRQEFALIRVRPAQLRRFLDTIQIDPGFGPLLELLEQFSVPVAILSDGIDTFIRRILKRVGRQKLTVLANAVRHRDSSLDMHCPHGSAACASASAHCKCASAERLQIAGRRTIYVGDGRSDLCPSRKADCVFAKAALARNLDQEHRPYLPYAMLGDVADTLARAWGVEAQRLDAATG